MRANPSVLDFLPHMDGGVFSCYVNLIKPDPAIYRCLLEMYGLKAEECLFIDDREDNVVAARKLGIQAERFENYEQARAGAVGFDCGVRYHRRFGQQREERGADGHSESSGADEY